MQTESILHNDIGASAVDEFEVLVEKAQEIASGLGDVFCVAHMLESQVSRQLSPGFPHGSDQGFYYFGTNDCRVMGFSSREVVQRVEALDKMADDLQRSLSQLHRQMKAPVSSETSEELEEVISAWQSAHKKWRERLDIGDETQGAESQAEHAAAQVLLSFQCRTPDDVQRKVVVINQHEHLAELGASSVSSFLPSLIVGGVA